MKELRFRAWSKKHNSYLKFRGMQYDDDKIAGIFVVYGTIAGIPNTICLEPEDVIIEQYTGLKDKNGKEIYEGDVVKVNDDFDMYGINAGEIYEVYFNAGGFRCKPKYGLFLTRGDKGFWIDDGNDYEVIGNVHENAVLLGVKEEE